MEQKLATAKASNVDRLEGLKGKIKQLKFQALRKKKEYEAAKGDSRRIVGGKIERLFRDLDRFQGQEKVIVGNIERLAHPNGYKTNAASPEPRPPKVPRKSPAATSAPD